MSPPGSVNVSAGGQVLVENVDYIIDYNLGTVKILNQGLISSGVPVKVFSLKIMQALEFSREISWDYVADYLAKQNAREEINVLVHRW